MTLTDLSRRRAGLSAPTELLVFFALAYTTLVEMQVTFYDDGNGKQNDACRQHVSIVPR